MIYSSVPASEVVNFKLPELFVAVILHEEVIFEMIVLILVVSLG